MEEDSSVHTLYLAPDIEAVANRERTSIGLEILDPLRQKLLFMNSLSASGSAFRKYMLGDGIGAYRDAEDHKQADPEIARYEACKHKPK